MGNSVADFKDGKHYLYRDRVDLSQDRTMRDRVQFGTSVQTSPPVSSGKYNRVVDVNHPKFYAMRRAREGSKERRLRDMDMGDPFALERSSVSWPGELHVSKPNPLGPLYYRGYDGAVYPSTIYNLAMVNMAKGASPAISSSLGIDKFSLESLGSTAIAKSIPDIPYFSLFRFVGELREGLPKIPLKILAKEKKLRNVGGEYLNYQFGIAPLISDLQDFLQALNDPKLRSAVKHQLGQENRVRKVLQKEQTTSTRSMTSAEMSVGPAAGGVGTITSETKMRIWSSCSFAYYQVNELQRLLDELDHMTGGLGVVPTAIDIWNLIPWSWLIDWFTNFNHVITNLSYLGRDGLYLQRGYLMAHYQTREVHVRDYNYLGVPFHAEGVLLQERKYRVKASPFGFGYTWKQFNDFQLSILGALGVSRLRF